MSLPSENGNTSASLIWNRVRSFFESSRDAGFGSSTPRHRGVAIAVCLLTSCLLWFVFSLQKTYSLSLDLPTAIVNLPPDRALTELPPKRVRVRVRGEGVSLFQLYYNRPVVPIDAAREVVNLDTATPDLPKNLTLEAVTPRSYAPRVDQRATRKVPIRLRTNVTVPPTHELVEPPRAVPDSVLVSGAASIVGELEYWPTFSFEHKDLTDSLAVRIPLVDTLTGIVEKEIGQIRLVAVSKEFTGATRELEVILEGAPSTDKLVTLEPTTITVKYRVLLSDFRESLQAQDFFATVHYEDIRSDTTGRVKPRLYLPDNLMIRDVQFFPSSLRYYNYLVNN